MRTKTKLILGLDHDSELVGQRGYIEKKQWLRLADKNKKVLLRKMKNNKDRLIYVFQKSPRCWKAA